MRLFCRSSPTDPSSLPSTKRVWHAVAHRAPRVSGVNGHLAGNEQPPLEDDLHPPMRQLLVPLLGELPLDEFVAEDLAVGVAEEDAEVLPVHEACAR